MEGPFAGQRSRRLLRHPVFAGALGVIAVLLFCWPFVRVPPPSLWLAYLHMFGSWAAIILVLWWMSRWLGSGPDRRNG